MTVVAFKNSKKELGSSSVTLDQYTKVTQFQFMAGTEKYNPEIKDTIPATLAGIEAQEFETVISSNRARRKSTFITFKTKNYYYNLVIAGPAAYYDVHHAKVRSMLDSFRETIKKDESKKKK